MNRQSSPRRTRGRRVPAQDEDEGAPKADGENERKKRKKRPPPGEERRISEAPRDTGSGDPNDPKGSGGD